MMFRSRRIVVVTGLTAFLLTGVCVGLMILLDPHNTADHIVTDWYHRKAVAGFHGPRDSGRVGYLTITDDTYDGLGRRGLERDYLARVHRALADQSPAVVAYDIIFARPSRRAEEDRAFARALGAGGDSEASEPGPARVFLPAGFALCDGCTFYRHEVGEELDLLFRSGGVPAMTNPEDARPFAASRGILPDARFAVRARGHGHVSAPADDDRILRHVALLIQVGDRFVPGLAFAVFLDHYDIELSELTVDWGREVRVPAERLPGRDTDLLIPIDDRGRAYVPFAGRWNEDFPQMRADSLLRYAADPELEGNLHDLFVDRFVFVGDVSTGVSDAADTPLERRAPLVVVHAHLMNALITGEFYARASRYVLGLVLLFYGLLLGFCAVLRNPFVFYSAFAVFFGSVFVWGYFAFLWQFILVPTVTCVGGLGFIAGGIFLVLRVSLSRERTGDLRKLNAELLIFQHQLEDLVTERTRDLNASLGQIEADLKTARQVQQKILPPRDLDPPGVRYHYEYLPLNQVGGDFIDIALVRPDVLRIFLADAVGHGVQASLLTMTVKSEYENLKTEYRHPHELLEEYNRRLYTKYDRGLITYIPCFLADFHINEGHLRHASSGMPDQFCFTPAGKVVPLTHTGPAVGFMPEAQIETIETSFPPGSLLLIFSDGLPETHDSADDMLGEEGIVKIVAEAPSRAPRDLVADLLARADEFRGDHRVLDDVTVLALDYRAGHGDGKH